MNPKANIRSYFSTADHTVQSSKKGWLRRFRCVLQRWCWLDQMLCNDGYWSWRRDVDTQWRRGKQDMKTTDRCKRMQGSGISTEGKTRKQLHVSGSGCFL